MATSARPLVVDLDGSFLRTDSLVEMLVVFLRASWTHPFLFAWWLVTGGRSLMKAEVASRVSMDWVELPVNSGVVEEITQAKADGRPIVLATAAAEKVAQGVAQAHDYFDDVLSSTDTVNLKGSKKAEALVKRYGKGGFDYIGNDQSDLSVFAVAHTAYGVRPSKTLARRATESNQRFHAVGMREPSMRSWVRAMRLHQWAKNLLILIPAIGAEILSLGTVATLLLAVAVFSLFASSVYLLNDVLDVHHDRKHPIKASRPFAAGELSLAFGVAVAFSLGVLSIAVAVVLLGADFALVLGAYALLTILYSTVLKSVVLLDVFVLAVLYGTRLVAGAVVVNVPISPWLIGFSFFAFLSLALVKRYTELALPDTDGNGTLAGRGYRGSDSPLVMMLGVASTFAATVVLTLYIEDPTTAVNHENPLFLWALSPLFLLWASRVWLLAHRGKVDDDPVRFALTDRVSYVFAIAIVLAWIFAR